MNRSALRDRFADVYLGSIPFFTLNVLWVIVSLPIVTIIPATAALFYATNRMAHGDNVGASTFIKGLRQWFWRSYLWGGLNLLVIVVLGVNLIFYTSVQATWATIATIAVASLLVLWLLLQVSMFPLLLEQEKPSLRLALRNSFVVWLRRLLPTLAYALLIAAIVVVTTLVIQPAWLFVSASACAYLANRATLSAVRAVMGAPPDAADENLSSQFES